MAKLGNKTSDKETTSSRKLLGDKDVDYIEQLSRQAVEDHLDLPLLYFALDWEKSKRNFYGELLMKKFKVITGVPVKAQYIVKEGQETLNNGIPNQLLEMNIAIFVEQLKELNIEPKLDDYFALGQRLYRIHTKSINDSGVSGTLLVDRKRVQARFYCIQDDDEVLQKDVWGDNLGLEYQINPINGDMQKK